MIDASAGYMKDGNKNRLRARDIHKIVDVFTKQQEIPKYAHLVSFAEIEKNDYNLNIPRYIDSQEAEDIQDIEGHLRGGIPVADVDALQRYWEVCPQLRKALFKKNRPGYVDLNVDKQTIKSAIYEHSEFVAFTDSMNALFAEWRKHAAKVLKGLTIDCLPKQIIKDLSENLLSHYSGKPLIDEYDVYQHLMDYWAETMQDDCYLIATDGWKAETYRIIEKDKKGKEKDKGWACDLVPKPLTVARYFAREQETITKLEGELESVTAQLTELEEEHGEEEGAFSSLDKVNKASITSRLKEIKGLFSKDEETKEEADVLNTWVTLSDQESELKKRLRDAEATLDAKAYGQYPKLTEAEIKTLVIDDKWLAELDTRIHGEMDRISQVLTQRVKDLYAEHTKIWISGATGSWLPVLSSRTGGQAASGTQTGRFCFNSTSC